MTDTWHGGIVESAGDDGPPAVEEWYRVDVPGRPDRFAGVDGAIAYRTSVPDPRSDADERAVLELRGAYDRVRVYANGELLGEDDTYFRPTSFEFDPQPENDLVIVCSPPESFAGIYATDEVPAELAVPGIWWDVDVAAKPATFLRSLEIRPRLEGAEPGADGVEPPVLADGAGTRTGTGATAAIDVNLEVDAGRPTDDAVTLSLRPEGFGGGGSMERERVAARAGTRETVSTTMAVRDPSLWWPRGYGPQHRYTVRAKLGDDALERSVGLRTVERDADGFRVNGQRIRARGFTRLPGGDERADVERAREANANLLRTRAHIPPRDFLEACDEAGVLAWIDLPAAGADVDSDGGLDVERGTELAGELASLYGSHPSVAAHGVLDGPTDAFADPLGSGRLARLALRWRAWRTDFDRGGVDDVAAAFPDGVPVVPLTGAPGTDPDAADLAPGWRYLEAADVDWLLERYPSLAGAVVGFGAGSIATQGDEDGTGTGADDGAVPADADAVPGLEAAILERRGLDAEASRTYQATVLRTVAAALRRRGCGIVAAATIRDTARGGGKGVYERDGTPKPAKAAIADAYEPVQAVLDGPPAAGSVGVTVVNDTPETVAATVSWAAGSEEGETSANVPPHGTAAGGSVTVPGDADAVVLETTATDRTVRNRYDL